MDQSEVKQYARPFIVGIGASAGGVEALESFFRNFPPDSGMTFVVIQHLSPNFKSMMDELLVRCTSMKVQRVEVETEIEPNAIYLISPKMNLTMRGNTIVPSEQDQSVQPRLPIDTFFESLAKEHTTHAIAVVLSGTGSDGTRGASLVKENEGFVIAQSPESCRFDGMPTSLIKLGLPDRVLPPEKMSDTILNYVLHPGDTLGLSALTPDQESYRTIIRLLRSVDDLDFTDYRHPTMVRRIERRIKANHLGSVEDYVQYLHDVPTELTELHNELLINVTRFFRDTEEFAFFEESALPELYQLVGDDDTVRVWVVGCSTGEEALSIGILLLEHQEKTGQDTPIKIFATDVDRGVVEAAASGIYPESVMGDVSQKYLRKYFREHDSGGFVPVDRLRRCIIFSKHNALRDPPFTKVHLICCRNVLIYFQPRLQNRALSLFHFGLRSGGLLFLGKSEALGTLSSEFEQLAPGHRVFRKARDKRLTTFAELNLGMQPSQERERARPEVKGFPLVKNMHDFQSREVQVSRVYEKLLEEFVPACVVIDEDFQLLHVFGDAARFLNIPMGRASFDVLKMLDKSFSLTVSTAVSRALKLNEDVIFQEIEAMSRGEIFKFDLRVKLIRTSRNSDERLIAIFFGNAPLPGSDGEKFTFNKSLSEENELLANLEDQLRTTRESLQHSIETLETTNEELQSSNEELMSSNEELQSSNEELQSVNEELHTVNAEYQLKIEELSDANSDIDFLLKSSGMGIMFLDQNLCIRRYNQEIQALVSVMSHDIGRPVTDLKFQAEAGLILQKMHEVIETERPFVKRIEIGQADYILRILPYGSGRDSRSSGGLRPGANNLTRGRGLALCILDTNAP